MIINKKWFTLIEVIVALTIFSIIMISVMSIYIISSETTYNSDINRAMQESIKTVSIDISEDIIKNGIYWVEPWTLPLWWDCKSSIDSIDSWIKFCTWKDSIVSKYMLSKETISWYAIASIEDCDKIDSLCFLTKQLPWWLHSPLTNSLVTVRNIEFKVSNYNWVKKVTILLKVQPSIKSWVRTSVVKSNVFNFQTTISERPNNK